LTREELGAKVRRLQQAVAEVHGHTHLDGVTVRTDSNGRLTELGIAHDAWTRGPEALADLITRVCRDTAQEVQIRSTAIMAELRDDPIVARIADATIDSVSAETQVPVTSNSRLRELSQPDSMFSAEQTPTPHSVDHPVVDARDDYFHRKSWLE
jgi:DNA-binding protein YbaB